MPSAVQYPSVQWWNIDVPEDTSLALHLQHAVNYVPLQQCVQHTELPEASGIGLKRLCCLYMTTPAMDSASAGQMSSIRQQTLNSVFCILWGAKA